MKNKKKTCGVFRSLAKDLKERSKDSLRHMRRANTECYCVINILSVLYYCFLQKFHSRGGSTFFFLFPSRLQLFRDCEL